MARGNWRIWDWFRGRRGDDPPQEQFARQRAALEAAFFHAAAGSGKPRGLRWKSIDWQSAVCFARARNGQGLLALVGITIAFEAIPGSDMEGLAAVGNLRHASAVFHHQRGRWITGGRALFNLAPSEALAHFNHEYEPIEATPPRS